MTKNIPAKQGVQFVSNCLINSTGYKISYKIIAKSIPVKSQVLNLSEMVAEQYRLQVHDKKHASKTRCTICQ